MKKWLVSLNEYNLIQILNLKSWLCRYGWLKLSVSLERTRNLKMSRRTSGHYNRYQEYNQQINW